MYDVIVGTDTLRKMHATIDFTNETLECTVTNTKHIINLGYVLSQGSKYDNGTDRCRPVDLQKPAVYRMDKITSHGLCTSDKPVSYTHLDVYKRQHYILISIIKFDLLHKDIWRWPTLGLIFCISLIK